MKTNQQTSRLNRLIIVRRLAETGSARALRQSAGLSTIEMANAVGVSASTISRWETHNRRPHGEAALRWAEILDGLSR